jgi:hypothetical protein
MGELTFFFVEPFSSLFLPFSSLFLAMAVAGIYRPKAKKHSVCAWVYIIKEGASLRTLAKYNESTIRD